MKKPLIALAVLAACSSAFAQEDPAVAAAKSANDSFVSCVQALTTAAGAIKSESTQALLIKEAPDTCSKSVRVAPVSKKVDTAYYVWDGVKFVAGLVAQYKGQALIWGAVQAMTSRSADSTDNAVNGGYSLAGKGMDASAAAAEAANAQAAAALAAQQQAAENVGN